MQNDLTPGIQRGRWLVQQIKALQAQQPVADPALLRARQKELRQLVATLSEMEVAQILAVMESASRLPGYGNSLN